MPCSTSIKHWEFGGLGDEGANSLQDQIDVLTKLGWRQLELRTINNQWIAEIDNPTFNKVRTTIKDAGMSVPALSSRIGNWETSIDTPIEQEITELRILIERAHALECKFIRVMSFPNASPSPLDEVDWRRNVIDRMATLTHEAQQADIVLVHENCAGWAGLGPQQSIDLVKTIDSPHLRLLCDIGNCIAYGYEPLDFVRMTLPWTVHVHIKDARRLQNGETEFTWPGEGEAQVACCVSILLENGYTGTLSIEPHLHLMPHLKQTAQTEVLFDSFFEYGTRLERLLQNHVAQQMEAET